MAAVLLGIGVVGLEPLLDSPIAAAGVSGLDVRFEIWTRAQYALQDFPFTGVGIGNFDSVVHLLYPTFLIGADTPITHAHNLYLQVALDLGLAGLPAWLAAYMLALVGAWALWRDGQRRADYGAAALGAALLAGQAATGVHGLTDAIMWSTAPVMLMWAAWGLCVPTPELVTGEDPY
jgi:putative inorganic carbon (HCO3(-)) transporter